MKKHLSDFLVFIGFIILGYLAVAIVSIAFMKMFNFDILAYENGNISPENMFKVKLYQGLASLSIFGLPSVLFMYLYKNNYDFYEKFQSNKIPFILYSIALLIAFSPIVFFTAEWNQKMQLPEMFSSIEMMMRNMEDKAASITEQFLTMHNLTDVILNVIIIGFIPGIVEELMFRGCFQNIFYKMTQQKHLAIWLAAFLFSAIHFQFYGFVPRMLLGALFGYVYFSTKSIWIPIAMHVFNNSFQVIMAYFNPEILGKSDKDVPHIAWYAALCSAIISLFIYRAIKNENKQAISA